MAKRDNFSVLVSKTLITIGYKWTMIEQRRNFVKFTEQVNNQGVLSKSGIKWIMAGSRREGVSKLLGGDTDSMHLFDEMIAAENVRQFESRSNLTVLEIDIKECPPGYGLLKLVKHGGRAIQNILGNDIGRLYLQTLLDSCCCVSDVGVTYLSNEKVIDTMTAHYQMGLSVLKRNISLFNNTTFHSRTGPSIPSSFDAGYVQTLYDNVYAITCHCPSIFETFRNRPRKHGWPPQHILQELSQLEAHVVPVGYKRSPRHFLEWRICFTKAEIRLIELLTEPQIHVFVLLKIYAKEVMKNIWDAMTSYIMKNVIMWMVELTPPEMFCTETIVDRFLDCLFFMKICIKSGRLPNYMIPDRNLLSHDTFIVKRKKLLSFLDDCLYEKGSCLLKSRSLNDALVQMYSSPENIIQYGLDKDQTETAIMLSLGRICTDVNIATFVQDIIQLVLSGNCPEFVQLVFQYMKPDMIRDPIGSIQRFIEMVIQNLK